MQFCKEFNARTSDQMGMVIPVVITVFADRSFQFHHEDTARCRASAEGCRPEEWLWRTQPKKVGKVTEAQIREIATTKLPDLNTDDVESAMKHRRGHRSFDGFHRRRLKIDF